MKELKSTMRERRAICGQFARELARSKTDFAAAASDGITASCRSNFCPIRRLGREHDVIQNQAVYVANWIKALKADPKLVIVAASQAQKAANLILGIVPEDVAAQPAEATA